MYVYCTCYAPICHANGMEKASFARFVGAEKCASAGNQTRVARVAGEHSTTEPPMLTLILKNLSNISYQNKLYTKSFTVT